MCRLRNIAMHDYQENVTTKKVQLQDRQTDARQSDPYVPLCLAGDIKILDFTTYLAHIYSHSIGMFMC